MAAFIVFLTAVVFMILMSARADRRFASHQRLPMQWGFDGSVNWSASRRVALAFTPALAIAVMCGIGLLASRTVPANEQNEFAMVAVVIGIGFIATHALHLWLISRSVESGRN